MLQQTPLYAKAGLLFLCLFVHGPVAYGQETSGDKAEQKAKLAQEEKLLICRSCCRSRSSRFPARW